ncbi:MAG: MMPL family transporter, partial [Chloroflexi bacterium]|nr:MMPL family transporter [Chloroflexota bacterium]
MATRNIPSGPQEITPEWLTDALRETGAIKQATVTSFDMEPDIAAGTGFLGKLARVKPQYDRQEEGAPQSIIAKFPTPSAEWRAMADGFRFYEIETRFYEEIAEEVELRTPRRYFSHFDSETGDFVLLLEDLAPARMGDQMAGCTRAEAELCIGNLAKFHATWWESPRLAEMDWLPMTADPLRAQVLEDNYREAWPAFAEYLGDRLSPAMREIGERFGRSVPAMIGRYSKPPHTIVHGDYRLDNLFFTTSQDGDSLAVIDWQISSRGTGVFDILVETDEPEALFRPRFLKKIEAFQRVIESHGIVGGTTSVVDYLKQMNRSLNEGNSEEYRLIDDEQLNAQLFLLYSTTGDPTDLEEEIDYDYQRANIRVNLKSPSYQELKPVIASLNEYIEAEFNEPGLKATLSGAAMVFYEMTDSVGKSHFNSVLISLILVLFMATIVFRSVVAGLMSLTPVAISILFVYAVMANFGISIGIGTSMFASISIGLGVDFAIHTIDRVRDLYKNSSDDDYVMLALFPSTGRALFFNLLALACGFGVLITSEVVP